jgi:hypothetical protein
VKNQLMLMGSLALLDIHASMGGIRRDSALMLNKYPGLDHHRP